MARTYILADDLNGIQDDTVETVTYAYAGQAYEIDLTDKNRQAFDKAMSRFVMKSRKLARLTLAARPGTGASGSDTDAQAIREWAKANGIEVGEKGRISQEVKDQYDAAMKESDESEKDSEKTDESDDSKSE